MAEVKRRDRSIVPRVAARLKCLGGSGFSSGLGTGTSSGRRSGSGSSIGGSGSQGGGGGGCGDGGFGSGWRGFGIFPSIHAGAHPAGAHGPSSTRGRMPLAWGFIEQFQSTVNVPHMSPHRGPQCACATVPVVTFYICGEGRLCRLVSAESPTPRSLRTSEKIQHARLLGAQFVVRTAALPECFG